LTEAADLRSRAEDLAGPLPPLLAAADHLASTVLLGEHGRRRAGLGDQFWQYRQAVPGDEARMIDWRRSGRSDVHFVREKEWQAAQSVLLWVDRAQSMVFSSSPKLSSKSERARLLALALSTLLIRGGERVGLTSLEMPPRSGELQLLRLAEVLADDSAEGDYGTPEVRGVLPHSRAVFVSDFLGDITAAEAAITKATDRGVSGAILQILDPQEEAFPFDGRTIFESMGRSLSHETMKAGDLRGRYLERLAERKDRLAGLARATGWQYDCHHTDKSASGALLWLYRSLERVQH
jgi:uncharacterized protein (DUF58 family)